MKIIIIGCGKVGRTLAQQLSAEQHDIVLVDTNAEKLQEVTEEIDAMTLVGNGASIGVQKEAGVETADMLIAITNSDELNLLCCLIAKKVSKCETVARVRNPIYSEEINFIKERLGVSMSLNPELATATEMARLLRFPSAIQIDTFAKGRVELLKFKVKPEFDMDGLAVSGLADKFKCDILICGVERDGEVTIPGGNFILKDNDLVSIVASPTNSAAFFKKIGLGTNQVKNALIVGGGTLGYYLAKQLLSMKIRVRIVEKDVKRCEELSELLPEAVIINGDGTDKKLLLQSGLQSAEAFITLTNIDEENIFLALYAKDQSNAKLITKVNRFAFDNIIEKLDLGSVIYPKYITADYILQYVRAMQNSIGSNVETLYQILDNQAEALEFSIREDGPVVGVPLMDLALKKNLLVACINHNGRIIIPRGHDQIQIGDTVIIVTTEKGLQDINDILRKQV
ncbi:MAG: Trk system potassium transporter TrkA [Lachnospiraceae bacterium]|jgi:trk system potassium uptake protein TrkA